MKNDYYNRNLEFALTTSIWKHHVNIYCEPSLTRYVKRMQGKSYGIPAFDVSGSEIETKYKIIVTRGEDIEIEWKPEEYTALLKVHPRYSEALDKEVAFLSLSISEYMRQLEGKCISNACGISTVDNRGVILFGKRAHGKTSVSLLLCKERDYRLIGSDQVIFGFHNNNTLGEDLWMFEGTKYVTLRRATAEKYFPEYIEKFKEGKFWDDKINIRCDELNIKISDVPAQINRVFLVNLDFNETVPLSCIDAREDLETSLFLPEIVSRHITGICSPILDEKGAFLSLSPSFDDHLTRSKRKRIIQKLIEAPIYKITGGNIYEMADTIDRLTSFSL